MRCWKTCSRRSPAGVLEVPKGTEVFATIALSVSSTSNFSNANNHTPQKTIGRYRHSRGREIIKIYFKETAMRHLKKTILVGCSVMALFIVATFFVSPARAECDVYCFQRQSGGTTTFHARHHRVNRSQIRVAIDANGNGATIIGGRPNGCPHSYCGCGLRMYLGLSDKRLNLASNWARLFPRTSAQPGAAAVRSGHVMLLVSHVQGSVWIVRDYNSGNGLSRIHARSVAGYVFVNPS